MMSVRLLMLSACVVAISCNSKPKATESTLVSTTDTTVRKDTVILSPAATTKGPKATVKSTPEANGSGTVSSELGNEAKAKKGLSKTAKGAIIGGVVGAGTGAVVNKKNRLAGGVVGGVIGAGSGAVIGHELDKKSGKH